MASDDGDYALSVLCEDEDKGLQVRHCDIKAADDGNYYISVMDTKQFTSIADLIDLCSGKYISGFKARPNELHSIIILSDYKLRLKTINPQFQSLLICSGPLTSTTFDHTSICKVGKILKQEFRCRSLEKKYYFSSRNTCTIPTRSDNDTFDEIIGV